MTSCGISGFTVFDVSHAMIFHTFVNTRSLKLNKAYSEFECLYFIMVERVIKSQLTYAHPIRFKGKSVLEVVSHSLILCNDPGIPWSLIQILPCLASEIYIS